MKTTALPIRSVDSWVSLRQYYEGQSEEIGQRLGEVTVLAFSALPNLQKLINGGSCQSDYTCRPAGAFGTGGGFTIMRNLSV